MRKTTLGLLAVALMICTLSSAVAQNDGLFSFAPSKGRIQFQGTGDGNFRLKVCSQVEHGRCIGHALRGQVTGLGVGFYVITARNVTGTLVSPTNCRVCRWMLKGDLQFEINTRPDGMGANLLTATLRVHRMVQSRRAINVNEAGFNQIMLGHALITGGLLAKYFGRAPIHFNIECTAKKNLAKIPAGQTLLARFLGAFFT